MKPAVLRPQARRDQLQGAIPDPMAVGVVDVLEAVEVEHHEGQFGVSAARPGEFAGQVQEHVAGVGQPGHRVGPRILARLLEERGVVDDGRGLLADALEQPAVLIAVEAPRHVVDRDRSDEPIVEDER